MANAYFYNNLRSVFHDFPLPFLTESGIFYPYLQIQVPGLEPRNITILATRDASASFLCRALSYIKIMVGWAGAP